MRGAPAFVVLLTYIWLMATIAFFISGGIIYSKNYRAQSILASSSCEVLTSSYFQTMCRGIRSSNYICYIPIWWVTYSIDDNASPNRNATIEDDIGYRTIASAENKLSKYEIGISYLCWYNTTDPTRARWDAFSTFSGLMLLISGAVSAMLFIVGFIGCVYIYVVWRRESSLDSFY